MMATASARWCFEHTPDLRLDSILFWFEIYLVSTLMSL